MDKNLFLHTNVFRAAIVVAALGLAACSSEPAKAPEAKVDTDATAKKEPAGPPEAVSGKTAFYEMYDTAHQWAADLMPLSLKSGEVAGVKNAGGKAGLWTATFGSAAQHTFSTYTYSVADQLPTISKGVKAEGAPQPWAGPTTVVATFQTSDFTIDSDAAYKTVAAKAAEWLKDPEHAAKSVSLSLGNATRFPAPVWYVLFGDTKSGYFAYVNATTGNIIEK